MAERPLPPAPAPAGSKPTPKLGEVTKAMNEIVLVVEILGRLVRDQAMNEIVLAVEILGRLVRDLEKRCQSYPAMPIDIVLFCPACGTQHIDMPETHADESPECAWQNPPHRTHLCQRCGHKWRPADVHTNGVAAIKTRGGNDSPLVQPKQAYDQT